MYKIQLIVDFGKNLCNFQLMAECFLYRHLPSSPPRYCRVEIGYDLFDDVAVTHEWGVIGGLTHKETHCFANLREASRLADGLREDAVSKGFQPPSTTIWTMQ